MSFFTVSTLGCKVNRYESEALSERLSDQGWQLIHQETGADLCIVNTCTVTGKAAMQSRQAVRKMVRNHPGAQVVVTGCYAQVTPETFTKMQNVHYVVGNTLKYKIPQLPFGDITQDFGVALVEEPSDCRLFQDLPITRFGRRTRAFLKIQDGCDAFCTYCIVPLARGRSRSLDPEVVVERIGNLGKQGYREVVLSGIHIGRYGRDLAPPSSLSDLICALDGPQGVERLRLSSIEPMELSEMFLSRMASSERLCPHLHIPLQSGDNDVLKAMNRPYTSQKYRDLIHHIVHTVPQVSIGVDVMGGFPSETDKAFENTCRLIKELPVAYLHVFPFSPQKGTVAERLPNHLSPEIKKKRCQHLRTLGKGKREAFCERFVGSTMEVLIEGKRDRPTGLLKGLTPNYISVFLQGKDSLFHRIVKVKISAIKGGRVYGRLST